MPTLNNQDTGYYLVRYSLGLSRQLWIEREQEEGGSKRRGGEGEKGREGEKGKFLFSFLFLFPLSHQK